LASLSGLLDATSTPASPPGKREGFSDQGSSFACFQAASGVQQAPSSLHTVTNSQLTVTDSQLTVTGSQRASNGSHAVPTFASGALQLDSGSQESQVHPCITGAASSAAAVSPPSGDSWRKKPMPKTRPIVRQLAAGRMGHKFSSTIARLDFTSST
jgi:hypothetical protein